MSTTFESPTGQRVTPTGIRILPASAPRADWLEARMGGITATDIVKIVGASNYGSAVDVYADKIGQPLADDELSEAGEWGQELEDYVARKWADRNGFVVRRVGLIRHDTDPVLLASLDRLVTGCELGRCAAEIKTRNAYVADQWEDGVPESVNVQVQFQLLVSGLDHIHVAALIGGQRLIEHIVRPDDVLASWLQVKAHEVWSAVVAGIPPVMDPALMTVDLVNRVYSQRDGVRVVDAHTTRSALHDYQAAHEKAKEYEAVKERAKVELLLSLGDGDTAIDGDGVVLFSYKEQQSRRTDLKLLEAEHPDVYADVVTTSASRVFRPAKGVTA